MKPVSLPYLRLARFLICIPALAFVPPAFSQGSLTPPPGPPGPAMQSLDQLGAKADQANAKLDGITAKAEKRIPISSIPVTISTPGSYYLVHDVTGSAGITITVSDVTIDLNGFTVSGVGKTAGGTATGIVGINDTTARNGRVKDWAGDGIRLGAGVTLEDLNVVNVGGACIKTSEQAQVRHCRVGLGDQGIVVGDSSVVESAISISNSGASPKSGIAMGAYGVITNCTSSYNAGQGILVGNGSSLSNLTASNNSGTTGIVALDGSTFTNCASFLNSGNGIKAGFGSTLIGCTAKSNALDGIAPGDGSTLSKCTVRENRHNGINIDSACTLDGNTAQSNGLAGTNSTGFAGIRVTGAGNRIDGNHFTFHNFKNFAIGMYVTGTGNLIIRNTSHGNNADYIIGSDNRYGPIIDITAAGTVAVLGRSATDTTTTTHPWANFVY